MFQIEASRSGPASRYRKKGKGRRAFSPFIKKGEAAESRKPVVSRRGGKVPETLYCFARKSMFFISFPFQICRRGRPS
ncbi:MAG: hypothetical protein C6P37_11285 [Caldibacillus debilis]|uniref:Uncharacterized protein n=1 Tax=Caldibacillus debilis TaxID=301148 RepID=A0A3E0K367_9BACI|nr:MAG: hypothetical protein C6P37_11285 [Caldibacillus debilis]